MISRLLLQAAVIISKSDLLYTQVYRKRFAEARLEIKADPDHTSVFNC